MAAQEHVQLLAQGSAMWGAWRKEHPKTQPHLAGADLVEASLSSFDLSNADLSFADLREASLFYASLKNANLEQANLEGADLHGADLSKARFLGTRLTRANLTNANLSGAELAETDLRYANLQGANLTGAYLGSTDLSGVDLSDAHLSGAFLIAVDLSFAKLNRTNVYAMRLMTTTFAWIDLRTVVGLNTVVHHGPSCVDVKTVRLPEDEAYIHFLRGTGFSNDFIDAFSSLPTSAAPRISCFISYADQDEAFARRLCNDLQNKGVRCWLARQDLREGTPFYEVIGRAVSFQGKALLLLSQHVVQSKWIAREVENALKREVTEHRNILSLLRLDDAIMHTKEPWATSLRDTRPIGDFTSWQNISIYRQRLSELLDLLKK